MQRGNILFIVMLNVNMLGMIMLNVINLSFIMLGVILLNAVMPSVVVPLWVKLDPRPHNTYCQPVPLNILTAIINSLSW
jgi:hypothetical protein